MLVRLGFARLVGFCYLVVYCCLLFVNACDCVFGCVCWLFVWWFVSGL